MKKPINFFLILTALQILCSCVFTSSTWNKTFSGEKIDKYYFDKNNKRLIFIEKEDVKTKLETYYYSAVDRNNLISKIFELNDMLDGNIDVIVSGPGEGRGYKEASVPLYDSKIVLSTLNISISLTRNLSDSEMNLIRSYKGINVNRDKWSKGFNILVYVELYEVEALRYLAREKKSNNFCSVDNLDKNCLQIKFLKKPLREKYKRNFTSSEVLSRVAITPFAVAADIILIPFFVVMDVVALIGVGVGGK